MRDVLVVNDVTVVEWDAPEEVDGFELSFTVGSMAELRSLLPKLGGLDAFGENDARTMLYLYTSTNGGRGCRVYVHLRGEDFEPVERESVLARLRPAVGVMADG